MTKPKKRRTYRIIRTNYPIPLRELRQALAVAFAQACRRGLEELRAGAVGADGRKGSRERWEVLSDPAAELGEHLADAQSVACELLRRSGWGEPEVLQSVDPSRIKRAAAELVEFRQILPCGQSRYVYQPNWIEQLEELDDAAQERASDAAAELARTKRAERERTPGTVAHFLAEFRADLRATRRKHERPPSPELLRGLCAEELETLDLFSSTAQNPRPDTNRAKEPRNAPNVKDHASPAPLQGTGKPLQQLPLFD
jgi:hypothetical protein